MDAQQECDRWTKEFAQWSEKLNTARHAASQFPNQAWSEARAAKFHAAILDTQLTEWLLMPIESYLTALDGYEKRYGRLLLRAILSVFVVKTFSTPAQSLQGLVMRADRWRIILKLLLEAMSEYGWSHVKSDALAVLEKFELGRACRRSVIEAYDRFMLEDTVRKKETDVLDVKEMVAHGVRHAPRIYPKLQNILKILRLLHYLAFLSNGKYLTMLDRLLQIRIQIPGISLGHQTSEWMSRQLAFQAWTEIVLILWPVLKPMTQTLTVQEPVFDLDPAFCALSYLQAKRDGNMDEDKYRIRIPARASCGCVYSYLPLALELKRHEEETMGDKIQTALRRLGLPVSSLSRDQGSPKGWKCLRCQQVVTYLEQDVGHVQDKPVENSLKIIWAD